MSDEHVKDLEKARERIVDARRKVVTDMAEGVGVNRASARFKECQFVIEAIDRAIADETGKPHDPYIDRGIIGQE
jgi:hypothetical protein